MFVANVVRFTKTSGPIVLRELSDHIQRLDLLGILIEHALSASDLHRIVYALAAPEYLFAVRAEFLILIFDCVLFLFC
jgi:hypothetical protein